MRPVRLVFAVVSILPLAGAGLPSARQHAGSYTPADVEAGAKLYGVHCSACHGADGALVAAVDLRRGVFRLGSTDEQLTRTIANGIPGTAMTPQKFTPGELHALVAYIRSMRDFGARSVAIGDPAAGAALFDRKGCLSCHRVSGKGSLFSVDLTEIGTVRSADALQRTLTEGTDTVAPQRRFIRAVTADGRTIAGRRLNEDTFTVQLITDEGRLLSLTKSELREYRVTRTSPRPAGKDTLSAEDRAHLVAYLASLRAAPATAVTK